MQSQVNTRKNAKASADSKHQANALSSGLFVTPEKKTKPCNYSPGKKPMRDTLQDTHQQSIVITPFVLF